MKPFPNRLVLALLAPALAALSLPGAALAQGAKKKEAAPKPTSAGLPSETPEKFAPSRRAGTTSGAR